jgi:hypothetical protein
VFAPVRFPLIDDDLHCHAAAPATRAALRVVVRASNRRWPRSR